MDTETICLLLKRQGPEARKLMQEALRLPPIRLEAFVKGDAERLTDDEVGKLRHWLRGDYVMTGTGEGYVLRARPAAAVLPPAARAPAVSVPRHSYDGLTGSPATGSRVERPATRPPSTNPDDIKAAKAREEAAASPKPKRPILGLMTFGRS